ncbi:MarR family transcriptional regulator [Pseudonocardiaceae bacterium YIM PH 21723]|nr:MarR family transcriptional regulator [Pseudonocardiaceae bacterium YIM PH 21723]
MTGPRSLAETEKAVQAKLGDVPLRHDAMAAIANVYRAAAAVRQHVENSVLREAELTWTGFVVLWVVWIFGEMETRHVAQEAGISKGTLTGVARTLESRGLVVRAPHPSDGRMAMLSMTAAGEELMSRLFPAFNAEEAFAADRLSGAECDQLAGLLRRVVAQLEDNGEARRLELLEGAAPTPRRSGRKRKD